MARDVTVRRTLLRAAIIGSTAAVVVAAAVVAFLSRPSSTTYRLRPFVLPNIEKPQSELSPALVAGRGDAKAPKGLVINFFFSTCPPCVAEMPRLVESSKRLPATVAMLGVDHGEPAADGLAFIRRFGVTYDVALDETGSVAPSVGVAAFPATLFVNSSGVVVKRHLGAISAGELQRGIELISHAA